MDNIPSYISFIQKSIIDNWDRDALTDYQGVTLQYKDIARKIEKLHILFENSGVQKGDKRNTLAFQVFAARCKKYIGAFMAQMNGCDLLIFTGGIGENAWFMRHEILKDMDWLGVDIDMELNDRTAGVDAIISKPCSWKRS